MTLNEHVQNILQYLHNNYIMRLLSISMVLYVEARKKSVYFLMCSHFVNADKLYSDSSEADNATCIKT